MYILECEIRHATGEVETVKLRCVTREDLEKTIALAKNCGHKILQYGRRYEE